MIHFTEQHDRVTLTRVPPGRPLGAIDYDVDDFTQEFAAAKLSPCVYRITPELRRFLTHMFGDKTPRSRPTADRQH
jgi:hypothetical protein